MIVLRGEGCDRKVYLGAWSTRGLYGEYIITYIKMVGSKQFSVYSILFILYTQLENETSEKVSAFHPDGGGTEEPMR